MSKVIFAIFVVVLIAGVSVEGFKKGEKGKRTKKASETPEPVYEDIVVEVLVSC